MALQEDTMKLGPGSLIGLLLLMILFGGGTSSPPPTLAPAAVAPTLPAEVEELLAEFSSDRPAADARPTQIILATVPDPVSSSSGWMIDRYLDAIQRGVEASDWLLFRHWVPWAGKEPVKDAPGVLKFRKSGSTETLIVFLIGESPTAGINKKAFRKAWWKSRLLAKSIKEDQKILGPSFSGSTVSLAEELRAQINAGPLPFEIKIISGSATNRGNKKKLEDIAKGQIKFSATLVDDETMLAKVVEMIGLYDPSGKERIAVLAEANTSYGNVVGSNLDGNPQIVIPFPLHISALRHARSGGDKAKKDKTTEDEESDMLELSLDSVGNNEDLLPALSPQMTSRSAELVLKNILETIYRERIRYVGLAATDTRDKLFLADRIRAHCPDVKLFTTEADILYLHPHYARDFEGMLVFSSYPLSDGSRVATTASGQQRLLQFPSSEAVGTYNATRALLEATDAYAHYLPNASSQPIARPRVWMSQVGSAAFWPLYVLNDGDPANYLHSLQGEREEMERGLKRYRDQLELPMSYTMILLVLCGMLTLFSLGYLRHPHSAHLLPDYFFEDTHKQSFTLFILMILTTITIIFGSPWLMRGWLILADPNESSHLLTKVSVPFVIASAVIVLGFAAVCGAFVERVFFDWRKMMGLGASKKKPLFFSTQNLARFIVFVCAIVVVLYILKSMSLGIHALTVPAPAEWAGGEIKHVEPVLYLRRVTQLSGGLSLLLPTLLVFGGLAGWCFYSLRRLYLERTFNPDRHLDILRLCVKDAQPALDHIRDDVTGSAWVGPTLIMMIPLLLLIWALPCLVLLLRSLPTFEGAWRDGFVQGGAALLYLCVLLSALKFAVHWGYFKKFLEEVAAHNAMSALDRVPKAMLRPLRVLLWTDAMTPKEDRAWKDLRANLLKGLERATPKEIHDALLDKQRVSDPDLFIAGATIRLVREVFAHLRNHLTFMFSGFFLLILAISSYPFQPQRLLMFVAVTITIPISIMLITVFVHMDRDEIISRMSNTDPGKITWDFSFFTRIFLYGVIPIAGVFSKDMPGLRKFAGLIGEVIQKALP